MIEKPVPVAAVADIAPGRAVVIAPEISGHPRPIALFRTGTGFRAIEDACSHLGASLAAGPVVEEEVECWLHHGRFCLATGEARRYPARKALPVFAVALRGDQVWLLPDEPQAVPDQTV